MTPGSKAEDLWLWGILVTDSKLSDLCPDLSGGHPVPVGSKVAKLLLPELFQGNRGIMQDPPTAGQATDSQEQTPPG